MSGEIKALMAESVRRAPELKTIQNVANRNVANSNIRSNFTHGNEVKKSLRATSALPEFEIGEFIDEDLDNLSQSNSLNYQGISNNEKGLPSSPFSNSNEYEYKSPRAKYT